MNNTTLPDPQPASENFNWRYAASIYLHNAGLYRQSEDLITCSDPDLAFQQLVCPDDSEHFMQVIVPTCKLPYCPICARVRAGEVAEQYTPIVQDALNASPQTYELRHVVLTTPYSINHSHINALCATIWSKAVWTLETLWGLPQRHWSSFDLGVLGGWEFGGEGHKLHLHLLLLCEWIDKDALNTAWSEATNGICQITYVRKVDGVENGVKEVTKYATKLTGLPPHLVPQLHSILASKRRIRSFGAFNGKLVHQSTEPRVCPICAASLVVLPLLNLRLGNNFAPPSPGNDTSDPTTAPRPPPTPRNLIAQRQFGQFPTQK